MAGSTIINKLAEFNRDERGSSIAFIGPWKLTHVPVVVNLSMTGDCLLGMSVLKAFGHPMIDFANQRLVLED